MRHLREILLVIYFVTLGRPKVPQILNCTVVGYREFVFDSKRGILSLRLFLIKIVLWFRFVTSDEILGGESL